MTTATIITGATGYVGSHLAADLLHDEAGPIVCLARGRGDEPARRRVEGAIRRAWIDQGRDEPARPWGDDLHVFEEDFHEPLSRMRDEDADAIRRMKPVEFWHSAAAVRFTEDGDGAVWNTNVEGIGRALRLATQLGAQTFNHVSTAYVAGKQTTVVYEHLGDGKAGFTNVYEEGKCLAEWLVVGHCRDFGLGWQIHRPSIVVGHSRTHRTASDTGIFRVAELSLKFKHMIEARAPGYFAANPLRLRVDPAAIFNAIPIDAVIAEMRAIAAAGPRALGRVYHLTSETPVSSLEAMKVLLGLVGIERVEAVCRASEMGPIDKMFEKGLKAYGSYMNSRLDFDRTNVRRIGADRYQQTCRTTLDALRLGTGQYLESLAAEAVA